MSDVRKLVGTKKGFLKRIYFKIWKIVVFTSAYKPRTASIIVDEVCALQGRRLFISFCCHCKRFSHDENGFDILKILFYYGKDSLASFKSDRSPPVVRVVRKVKS